MKKPIHINPQRLESDFQVLCTFGATASGGLNRPAFSPAHLQARQWLREECEQAGLTVHVDGAGNHFGKLACGPQGAPSLLLGSHLDSVPEGGRYDGALGVLAGLEVLRVIAEAGLSLPVNLELVDFSDEEGSLVSFLGSYALCGKHRRADLENPRGGKAAFAAGLQRANLTIDSILNARRDPATIAGFLELHIEQGKLLEKAGVPVGVVTSIAGIKFFQVVYHGRAEHAGTADMAERLDASQPASAFTLFARKVVLDEFPGCFANVGQVHYEPGAYNIVPGKATLSCELRAPEEDAFKRLEKTLLERAWIEGRRFGLQTEIHILGERRPVGTHPLARQAIQASADALGQTWMPIASRAGHDSQPMTDICPTGMIFVPSTGGISHSPNEATAWQDCLNGAAVLLGSALRLAASLA